MQKGSQCAYIEVERIRFYDTEKRGVLKVACQLSWYMRMHLLARIMAILYKQREYVYTMVI